MKLSSNEERTAYLRLRCLLLAHEKNQGPNVPVLADVEKSQQTEVIAPVNPEFLQAEIDHLKPRQQLLSSAKYDVYYANAEQIPWLIREIGRLREISFRAVGEGSGNAVDVDLFDSYYLQLFIWDKEEKQIVGGYRLGQVDEIVRKFGRKGLYSYSLFRFGHSFVQKINPGLELGRSFVRPEYQRSFAPLMLLWKGIAQFVVENPRYSTLFGPVSISDDYNSLSQQLLIDFLYLNEFDVDLSRKLRPRSPYQARGLRKATRNHVSSLGNLENLSEILSDIELDNKGVPVLIRQYLKLGGRMLGFNVDSIFSNVIDGLIYVDLRKTDPRMLDKYMGTEGAARFNGWHADWGRKTG